MSDGELAIARAFVDARPDESAKDLLSALMGAGVGALDAVTVLYGVR